MPVVTLRLEDVEADRFPNVCMVCAQRESTVEVPRDFSVITGSGFALIIMMAALA